MLPQGCGKAPSILHREDTRERHPHNTFPLCGLPRWPVLIAGGSGTTDQLAAMTRGIYDDEPANDR